jgi:phosphoribosylglycinamide formyltransferase 1
VPGLGRGRGRGRRRGRVPLRVGVLISGNGGNLQALIDDPAIEVTCVVSSEADAYGLERARRAGLPGLATTDETATVAFLERYQVDLVALAGYMRILSPSFVDRYSGRIVNVHPSLLPAFPGRTPITDALAHGVRVTGVTVHVIDREHPQVDTGPILLQEAVEVPYDDDAVELERRIHEVEHRLLPRAVREFGLRAGGR